MKLIDATKYFFLYVNYRILYLNTFNKNLTIKKKFTLKFKGTLK